MCTGPPVRFLAFVVLSLEEQLHLAIKEELTMSILDERNSEDTRGLISKLADKVDPETLKAGGTALRALFGLLPLRRLISLGVVLAVAIASSRGLSDD